MLIERVKQAVTETLATTSVRSYKVAQMLPLTQRKNKIVTRHIG